MRFEYDDKKSKSNKEKHGIDFLFSEKLWNDEFLICSKIPIEVNEERFISVGKIDQKYWTAITTERGGKIRIISVRRSRKKEIMLYESE